MKYLDTFRRAEIQEHEVTLDPDFVARTLRSNVIQFNRRKSCVEVNRETTESMLRNASDEDLADILSELGKLTSERRAAFYDTLDEYTRALSEASRRAGRG